MIACSKAWLAFAIWRNSTPNQQPASAWLLRAMADKANRISEAILRKR
jgi:hypothetical protein